MWVNNKALNNTCQPKKWADRKTNFQGEGVSLISKVFERSLKNQGRAHTWVNVPFAPPDIALHLT